MEFGPCRAFPDVPIIAGLKTLVFGIRVGWAKDGRFRFTFSWGDFA